MNFEEWSRENRHREHSTAEGCLISMLIGGLIALLVYLLT